jgi:NADPH:quinone reductase-like Zn-dependent oxidoreductase
LILPKKTNAEVHPIIDSVRPFEQIIEAFNDMRDGKIFGKVVIEM